MIMSEPTNRITEAALLIANVAQQNGTHHDNEADGWIHGNKFTVCINRSKGNVTASLLGNFARIPFGGFAVLQGTALEGVFSANEGYLNNADEFIADMRQLLEEK